MHLFATKHKLKQINDDPKYRLLQVRMLSSRIESGLGKGGDYFAALGIYHKLPCDEYLPNVAQM